MVSKETLQPILEAAPSLASEISQVLAERETALQGKKGQRPQAALVEARSGELLHRIREFFSI